MEKKYDEFLKLLEQALNLGFTVDFEMAVHNRINGDYLVTRKETKIESIDL